MRQILLIINITAFIASVLWLIFKPDYEPLISSLLTLGGLISFIIIKPKNKNGKKIVMKQKAGRNSSQYQSGGNMTINH